MAELLRRQKIGLAVGIAIGIVAMLIVLAIARNGGGSGGGGLNVDQVCVQRTMPDWAKALDKHDPEYKYQLMLAEASCTSP